MTPCEKLGSKVGDRFEVVRYELKGIYHKGDVLELIEDDDSQSPWFINESFKCKKIACNLDFLKPLKTQTEAERRGANFGVCGVVKATGEKFVFIKENGYMWRVCAENGDACNYLPKNIRLDHEPEYKEIPFSEATDDQRMQVDNLVHRSGETITQIFKFDNGAWVYTLGGYAWTGTNTDLITVRVPA